MSATHIANGDHQGPSSDAHNARAGDPIKSAPAATATMLAAVRSAPGPVPI